MMTAEQNVRQLLLNQFLESQAKTPLFSMRAYARKVGIPQSAISEIIAGKRRVTARMAEKILVGLGHDQRPRMGPNPL